MGWIHGPTDYESAGAMTASEHAQALAAQEAKKASDMVASHVSVAEATLREAAYAAHRAEVVAAPLTAAHAEMVAEGLDMGLGQESAEIWAKCQVAGIY